MRVVDSSIQGVDTPGRIVRGDEIVFRGTSRIRFFSNESDDVLARNLSLRFKKHDSLVMRIFLCYSLVYEGLNVYVMCPFSQLSCALRMHAMV